jgi:2,6-dihydroxypyridine 3-monooxygenase
MNPPKVIIIGGSLGGLLAATALRSVGCDVGIYERNETSLEDRGAGIRIQDYMMKLLAERAGIDLKLSNVYLERSRCLDRSNAIISDAAFPVNYSSWNTLYQLLKERVADRDYHLGANYVDHSEDAGGVTVTFADGRIARGDLLVFADGTNSTGRQRLLPDVGPKYAGYVCWRGLVPEDEVSKETRSICSDAFTLLMLKPGHMGIYPMPGANKNRRGDRLLNYVWYRNVSPGKPFEDLMTDRSGTFRPISLPPGSVREENISELRATAAESLAPAAAEIVARTENPFIQVIFDVEVPQMAFGRACLLGDAAFGGRPHLGAATAKASMNAWALADALVEYRWDAREALLAWQATQLVVGQKYVASARTLGERLQFSSDIRHDDPDLRKPWPSAQFMS